MLNLLTWFISTKALATTAWLQKMMFFCRMVAITYRGDFMKIEIVNDPREIINECISLEVRKKFTKLIMDAYQWSNLLIKNTSVFKSTRGIKRLLPEIKNVAVEFFVMQAVRNKEVPFSYRIGYNSNRSHPFIELFNDSTLVHFNQVRNKNSGGRRAFCRDRHLKPITSYIDFEDGNTIKYEDQLYFQVNHGYQTETPGFITLGIPNLKGKFETSIYLLEEFSVFEGYYPKSKIEDVDEISFEDFQRFAEGEETNESFKGL